jgi:hypothetical protein
MIPSHYALLSLDAVADDGKLFALVHGLGHQLRAAPK